MKYKQLISEKELKDYISDMERDLMFQVIMNMKNYKLTMQTAHYIAKDFLEIFPVSDIQRLLNKLKILAKEHEEIRAVFITYAKKYYEKQKDYILTIVPPYIKNGEIEQAVQIVKGGNYHE